MNDNSLFVIALLLGFDEYVEEERTVLTERVDYANPFFNFEPYKKVDWTKLKDPKGTHFECLCEIVLSKHKNLIEIQPVGKTNAADRGRDFIVIENSRNVSGKETQIKWLVQCKYSDDSINHKTVPDWTNRVLEHSVDGYWLITNNDVTPALFDQLTDVPKNIGFAARLAGHWSNGHFIAVVLHLGWTFVVGLLFVNLYFYIFNQQRFRADTATIPALQASPARSAESCCATVFVNSYSWLRNT
jgi:hypothetical protein